MRSWLLVTLQLALMAAIALPWDAGAWNTLATLAVATGLAIGGWALTANRPGNFNIRPDPKADGHLVTGGPYRFIRHPMYLAVLLFIAGFCIGYATPWRWGAWLALLAVLHVKARVEEAALAARHPGYAGYARRTKRIVPFVW